MSDTAKFTTAAAARAFLLGGHATVTLVSKASGTRYTYRVRASDAGDTFFVSLLGGPDNEADYRYLGRIDNQGRFWAGRRIPQAGDVGRDAPSSKAFDWAWGHLKNDVLPVKLEIWHEGRCARCNRKLTVPSSIESGFGPECAGKGGFSASWAGF